MKCYCKSPKKIDEQIDLLITRGLSVSNREELSYYLKNINYYHLSIYFKYFQDNDCFYENISFNDILRIYKFDNKLRFLLLEVLERIEKSFKCRLTYEISICCQNAHWYLDKNFFINENLFKRSLKIITNEVSKSREDSILHYKKTYNNPQLPPIWNVVEILSFGQTIKICKMLKREYRNKVARTFFEDEKFIMNWLHCLYILRNNCAHHSRLWNKVFNFTPNKSHVKYKKCYVVGGETRLFDYLVILQIILIKINPTSSWLEKLKQNINFFKININSMGFPSDWEERLKGIT